MPSLKSFCCRSKNRVKRIGFAYAIVIILAKPAFAFTPAHDLEKWQQTVSYNLNATIHETVNDQANDGLRVSVIGLTIDKKGHPSDIHMVQSAGKLVLDKEAMRVAATLYYPPLPDSLHKAAQKIHIKVLFDADTQELADVNSRIIQQDTEQNRAFASRLETEQLTLNETQYEKR
ncbi:energy transducer TonB [Zymomonas mobilis]|uniref:TonB C-terminal domain-containing protein n=1 Tax=Zymomonas mobilis subsp. pomaceae (strain ATCC 29192 / DSM 22645 / JCM 10191 / CCUG 17912 / NBRC 13757 / NCIMB 11200 / NRRL B-4491 / Barker I) TaxID=579138 RepID=F8EU48_ZYMMT|nr:energy transducer TonB [Zymomonas mobilis]AEI37128.1 hypothetical protein Zymop_0225 [Zymomonas mobilis subsp. pomaceae ATCC 29192]MDX5948499.1 energy transducer TonB [Zymomonas mobilis subsp. pomaceae]GEB89436.1 hypothetical protein ZMO02_10730 [Zymomonas mobilis subsp. pomaceae]